MTGDLLGGRYRLGELLGAGGTAAVFRATDERLGREVAVKVVHAHLSDHDGVVARVLAEARASARLQHPHVVRVLDAGVDPGPGAGTGSGGRVVAGPPAVWMVLELVDGVTLAALVADAGPMRCEDALDVAAAVLAGLAHAHAHGVVHRDLSPTNVMVPRGDAGLDLGGALVLDVGAPPEPGAPTLVGGGPTPLVRVSPHYASPEAAQGLPTDARGDLYAVGALVHLMLTGAPPFDGVDPRAVLEAHVHTVPVPPSARRRGVPRDLDVLVLRALEKSPRDRFATAEEMRVAVVRCRAALDPDRPGGSTLELPPAGGRGPGPSPIRVPVPVVTARAAAPGGVPGGVPGGASGVGPGDTDHRGPRPEPREVDDARTGGGVVGLLVALTLVVGAVVAWQQTGEGDASAQPGPVVMAAAPSPAGSPSIPTSDASSATVPTPSSEPAVELVDVPSVVGLTFEAASRALAEAGLAVGVLARSDAPAPLDTVLSAAPGTGGRAAPGSAVDLVLASGDVVVPDAVGLGPVAARVLLESAGLVVSERETTVVARATGDAPAPRVTGTMPTAGGRAVFGGGVVVLVERVIAPVPVPVPTATAPGPSAVPYPSGAATEGSS
ncbi:protein kinase [Cellulomonas sp. P22]|uniref:protein kinase domain-containing protein n=1 Tax=Cellulomonas sp. P22 TaxID=3373189 RepID=UPI0037A556C5